MNIKDRVYIKQQVAHELGMNKHAPAIEVAKKFAESRSWKILIDDELLKNKAKALWLIVRIHQKESHRAYATRG